VPFDRICQGRDQLPSWPRSPPSPPWSSRLPGKTSASSLLHVAAIPA